MAAVESSSARSSFLQPGELDDYHTRVGPLNILPSRQNVLWVGGEDSAPCCLPPVPREPLSLGTPTSMEKQMSGSPTGSDGGHAPLLGTTPEEDELPRVQKVGSETLDESDALSLPEAVFNLTNTVLGVGVLSVPYAFRLSGYSTLLLAFLIITVTAKTANMVGTSLNLAANSPAVKGVPCKGRDFIFLAHVAFGRPGRVIIGFFTSAEIWFAVVTFMVMNGVNASIVIPQLPTVHAVCIGCALSSLAVFVPMRFFAYLSLVASVALLVAAAAMVSAAVTMESWANPYDHLGMPALLQFQNMPRSVGIIVFCFAGHPCFPVVHGCMKNRQDWPKVVGATFFFALLYYGGLGVFGYMVFGQFLDTSFTVNLAHLEGAAFCRLTAALAFLIKIQLTAPLLLNAVMVSLWAPKAGEPEWSAGRVLCLAVVTAFTALMASAFSDDVAAIASLTGNLFVMTTSVIFPALVHVRLLLLYGPKRSLNLKMFITHAAILAFGVVMAITGTLLTVGDMISRNYRSSAD